MMARQNFGTFSAENLGRMTRQWAADQRERETWKDEDRGTYDYRAALLEALAERVAALEVAQAENARLRACVSELLELCDDCLTPERLRLEGEVLDPARALSECASKDPQ